MRVAAKAAVPPQDHLDATCLDRGPAGGIPSRNPFLARRVRAFDVDDIGGLWGDNGSLLLYRHEQTLFRHDGYVAQHEDLVIVTVDGDVAVNGDGEGNLGDDYTFHADTRAPRALNAEVDGRELAVTFHEDLDESTIPPAGNFDVYVTRDGDRDDERVSRVEVEATEVILTLASAVRFDDDVEVFYDDAGTRALRDEAGNLAAPFDLAVANETAAGEAPGPPRGLTADADGASVIELNWRPPLDAAAVRS